MCGGLSTKEGDSEQKKAMRIGNDFNALHQALREVDIKLAAFDTEGRSPRTEREEQLVAQGLWRRRYILR